MSSAANVGIVIVSHSSKVAEGAADMVRQMVGDEVPCAWCGGNPDGGLGTDTAQIVAAIERVPMRTGRPARLRRSASSATAFQRASLEVKTRVGWSWRAIGRFVGITSTRR